MYKWYVYRGLPRIRVVFQLNRPRPFKKACKVAGGGAARSEGKSGQCSFSKLGLWMKTGERKAQAYGCSC